MTDDVSRCATCEHWSNIEPPIATGERRPSGADAAIGICRRFPPKIVELAGGVTTQFPQVHSSRTCGDWMPIMDGDGPNGGERVLDFNAERARRAA